MECTDGRSTQLLFLVGGVLSILGVALGYGRHKYDVPPANMGRVIMYCAAAGTFNLVASAFSKASFALTLLRLPVGWMKYLLWFIIITMSILINTSAASLWFACQQQPSQSRAPGSPASHPRWCLDGRITIRYSQFAGGRHREAHETYEAVADLRFVAAYSAATDITLAILPWKILWNLEMNTTEKTGALFAMSMGVLFVHPPTPSHPVRLLRLIPLRGKSAGLASAVRTTKIDTVISGDLSKPICS